MTDIYAYIRARASVLGCVANRYRREWYRGSLNSELTEVTLARRAFSSADESLGRVSAPSEIEEAISGVLAFHQLLGSEPASYDEMLDIAAAESGERVSTLAKALSRAARIWEDAQG